MCLAATHGSGEIGAEVREKNESNLALITAAAFVVASVMESDDPLRRILVDAIAKEITHEFSD